MNRRCQYAPVAPVALLQEMLRWGEDCVGPYHLLLAHDVLDPNNRDNFKQWARELRRTIFGYVDIIMDSSVIELGTPVDVDVILEAAEVVNATTIVLPDIIGDMEATHSLVDDAMRRKDVRQRKTMFVPQGKTINDYVVSLEMAEKHDWGTCIGLPRDAHKWIPSRYGLACMSRIISPDKPIHLLGFSNISLIDDFYTARHAEGVLGIDSAVPVRAGQKGMQLSLANPDYGSRGDYWEHKELAETSRKNIERVRNYLCV